MAPGHNADVVLRTHADKVPDTLKVNEHNFFGEGKKRFPGKLRPIVQGHAAEAHTGQHRHQLLGHMAAAKHKNPAGAVDLLGIEVPAGERRSVGMPGQQGEKRAGASRPKKPVSLE